MAFKGLSVSISGDSGDAIASLEALKQGLSSTQREANSAQDSMEEFGDSVSGAAARVGALSVATGGATASLGTFGLATGTATVAVAGLSTTLVPLVGTLGAVATAAAGVATAFGAVVGSGLLAFGEQRGEQNAEQLEQTRARIRELEQLEDQQGQLTKSQREELRVLEDREETLEDQTGALGGLQSAFADLGAEIQPIIVEFGEKFVPLIEDFFEGFPDLVENVFDALGPLDAFRDALRGLGQFIAENLPDAVALLVELGERALPAFEALGNALAESAGPALRGMIEIAERLSDEFVGVADAAVDLVPEIAKIGTVILETLLPVVEDGLEVLDDLLSQFISFAREDETQAFFREVAAAVGDLADQTTALIRDVISGFQSFAQSDAGQQTFEALIEVVSTLVSGISDLKDDLDPLFATLGRELPSILRALDNLASLAFDVGDAVAAGLVPVFDDLIQAIGDVADIINAVFRGDIPGVIRGAESLIGNLIDGLVDAILAPFRALKRLLVGNSIIPEIFNEMESIIRGSIEPISSAAQAIADAVSSALQSILDQIGEVKQGLEDIAAETGQDISQGLDDLQTEIRAESQEPLVMGQVTRAPPRETRVELRTEEIVQEQRRTREQLERLEIDLNQTVQSRDQGRFETFDG